MKFGMPLNKETKSTMGMYSSNPSTMSRVWHKVNTFGLNSVFLFLDAWLGKAKRTRLPYYLPIAGDNWGRIDEFMSFPGAKAQNKMQSNSSRIWNWPADSISYKTNYYTKRASYTRWNSRTGNLKLNSNLLKK